MGYLDSLNITGSALTAERFRTDIIMQNLANQNTTRTADGGPYRRKQVVFRENSLNFKSELGKAMTKAENGGVYVEEVVESHELWLFILEIACSMAVNCFQYLVFSN